MKLLSSMLVASFIILVGSFIAGSIFFIGTYFMDHYGLFGLALSIGLMLFFSITGLVYWLETGDDL